MLKSMQTATPKALLFIIALALVVPESYAKRMGSGRSVGRQTQMSRQRAPLPPPPRQQAIPAPTATPRPAPPIAAPSAVPPSQPSMARQPLPPTAPIQTPARQASSPWSGMLGGALLGLGLGSLMSHGDRNANTANQNGMNQNGENQTSGASDNGATASGAEGTQVNSVQQPDQAPQNRIGTFLLWGLLAIAALFLFRRSRARRRGY